MSFSLYWHLPFNLFYYICTQLSRLHISRSPCYSILQLNSHTPLQNLSYDVYITYINFIKKSVFLNNSRIKCKGWVIYFYCVGPEIYRGLGDSKATASKLMIRYEPSYAYIKSLIINSCPFYLKNIFINRADSGHLLYLSGVCWNLFSYICFGCNTNCL